jgi:hypothetical protein
MQNQLMGTKFCILMQIDGKVIENLLVNMVLGKIL